MKALLSAIVTWLSINFGLPATYDHPEIVFVPAVQVSDFVYADVSKKNRQDVIAVYNDVRRVIYLPDSWDNTSPADLSILVHEMVHLLERLHNDRFVAHMDRFMPQWRFFREELNGAPVGHPAWEY